MPDNEPPPPEWDPRPVVKFTDEDKKLLRPYLEGCKYTFVTVNGVSAAVLPDHVVTKEDPDGNSR